MEADIELLSLLWNFHASFQLYSKISKWAEHFFQMVSVRHYYPPRKASIKQVLPSGLFKTLQESLCCVLPTTNLQFDVVMHCFLLSLFSLLTNESLMQPESLF